MMFVVVFYCFVFFKFSVSIDGFTQFVIIEANNRADAERLAKTQYSTAKYIRFAGIVQ